MLKVNTSELSGAALDWAIAVQEGRTVVLDPMAFKTGSQSGYWIWEEKEENKKNIYQIIGLDYSPSSNWEQAGTLMERYNVYPSCYHGCDENNLNKYQAGEDVSWCRGDTPLVAVMRSLVRAKVGDEIYIPEGLVA